MNSKFVWKYRQAMMKRAQRIVQAHWSSKALIGDGELVEPKHLDIWFTRNIGRYGYWSQGVNVKASDMVRIQGKFWFDVIAILEDKYEVG